ncbi:uncharacterized protein LOC128099731 [Peromyscus californicus insignis]|uniref:uncharacterized protein LOC128099731 n=1 Tax=Peromyscus californicus insignis TaxID=564181 RepID=UPI0022A6D1F6|nr:uncharacterized protein LOC128099731 [Peromyscus californicus insignis]
MVTLRSNDEHPGEILEKYLKTSHRGDYGDTVSLLATGNRTNSTFYRQVGEFDRWLGLGGKSPIPTRDEAGRGARCSIPAPTGTKPTLPSLHPAYPATPTRASYRLQADPSGRHTCGEGALGARRRKPSCRPGNGSQALGVMVLPRSGRARGETRVRITLCAVGCTLNRNRKSCRRVTCPEKRLQKHLTAASIRTRKEDSHTCQSTPVATYNLLVGAKLGLNNIPSVLMSEAPVTIKGHADALD